eukprot:TRINITY_DN15502_c0_g1_i1.p1 TRINITY_DN15502_c0_g1~~TRINITY_DN15502_c0_g1_i1.p1  ORF type:complete len:163 (-),score=30.02 TRINITY_DN15502_c0_g1_i1:35-523(-)
MSKGTDRFGLAVIVVSTALLIFSVGHFINNKEVLGTDSFPLFYDVSGFPSVVGSGLFFVLCPITHLVMYLFFWQVMHNPKSWSSYFPVSITRQNANAQYSNLRDHLLFLQLFVSSFLVAAQATGARIALGTIDSLPEYFLPGFFLLFTLPAIHYFISSYLKA